MLLCMIDLVGKRFGRLVVKEKLGGRPYKQIPWRCLCDCGHEKTVLGLSLRHGRTKSCGCLNSEMASARIKLRQTLHGKSDTAEYAIWQSMLGRCLRPNNPSYKDYGERGITVCGRWMQFENFLADMGPRPAKLTLERKDNNGPYSPDNCVWASRLEQGRNKRNNVHLTIDNNPQILAEWIRDLGLDSSTVYKRLKKGMNLYDAIITPRLRRTAKTR